MAEFRQIEQHVRQTAEQFLQAGGGEVWLVASLADVQAGAPLIIVRGAADRDTSRLATWLQAQPKTLEAPGLQVSQVDANTWLVAHPRTLQRVAAMRADERPELTEAIAALSQYPVSAVLAPGADQRRVIRETLPPLPEPWREVTGDLLADGIRWSALTLNPAANVELQVTFQTRDTATASKVQSLIEATLKFVAEVSELKQQAPQVAALASVLKPQVVGSQVQIQLSQGTLQSVVPGVLAQPIAAARQAARRQFCANNLKQIGLAMHMYLDEHKSFPPTASRDSQGKPLLNWRVHLLPYLECKSLYDQFHLDEPWDSPHNRQLITQMPKMFTCPSATDLEPGKTTYVLPIGPGTVWGGQQPLSLREITDGTSQTAMVVEAAADKAVVWTQPEDLTVTPAAPAAGLGAAHGTVYPVLFCDGSVRFLEASVSAEELWHVLTPKTASER